MSGFWVGFARKMLFSILVGIILLCVSGYSLYLGNSISDIFTVTFLSASVLLGVCLYKYKNSPIGNSLWWNLFEVVGYGLFTLILCGLTEDMFHHFVLATTAIILFFKIVPSIIYSSAFQKKH